MVMESQESQASEDCPSDEEDDYYGDYYEGDDVDVITMEGSAPRDAAFQKDPEWYEFSCLSSEEVWNYLDAQVREVGREVKVEDAVCRTLLYSLQWNSKELIKRYSDDKNALLVLAQLKQKDPPPLKTSPDEEEVSCLICLLPSSEEKLFSLDCGHVFCTECWELYLTEKISSGSCVGIECMQCAVRVSVEKVKELLQSSEILTKYLRFSLAEYVQSHPQLRWCPGADCSTVFSVKDPQAKQVTCSQCNTSCCFKCADPYHCPTDCEAIKTWLIKCQNDSETANYIKANTKDCPKCHTAIEKNGGCNHMNCSQCGNDFCWMCLGTWKEHNGYYNCSKYKEDQTTVSEANKARKALEKYLFYYQRWANHDQSLKLEEATKEALLARIEEKVAAAEGTWIDWQYLLDAVALLRKCRYTLKYTYPFAYYLEGDGKPLFEYQQAQLEVEIENLSYKVERVDTTDLADLKQQMNVAEVKRLTLLRDFVNN